MRIGLFGGTFDPPHNGHLAVATAAVAHFKLDLLLMAPTGLQPLKSISPIASYDDRLAMSALFCDDVSLSHATSGCLFRASEIDATRLEDHPTYTIDTIRLLRNMYPDGADIFVVVGADAFADLRRWRSPDALLNEAEWIVVSRPEIQVDIHGIVSTQMQRHHVHFLADICVDLSATDLRRRLLDGDDVSADVAPAVLAYIQERGLYVRRNAEE